MIEGGPLVQRLLGWIGSVRSRPAPPPPKKNYETPEPCSKCGHTPCLLGFGQFMVGHDKGRQEHFSLAGAYRICPACKHSNLRGFAVDMLDTADRECKNADVQNARQLAVRLLNTPGRDHLSYRKIQLEFLRACEVCRVDSQKILEEEAQKLKG